MTNFNIGKLEVRECTQRLEICIPYVDKEPWVKYLYIYIEKEGIHVCATGTLNKAGQQALQDGLQLAKLLQKYSKVESVKDSFSSLQPEPGIDIDKDDEVNLDPITINRPL